MPALRVFLVEDLPAMRDLLVDLFTSTGNFRVVATASTEAEANLWLEDFRGRWDLAVVDLILAEGSGLGVVPRAKALHPGGRVAVLTAYASPGIEQHLQRAGAERVFDKAHTEEFIEWLNAVGAAPEDGPPAADSADQRPQ